ncbi:hypothetical protein HC026_02065 [Lactobacillus sp. LC28-10]|uniref:Uncharacterized protein n=1 Tax=Secundilactobacillus angelensis TaxID=2722706 RepID=A0ABX1KX12_9LACO|nr:hypothetical protein [Secundilactobacillus angelensis]MCH5461487.1 hypothetical protein [Secundilactobacillus angelensis]NLR17700.1 hypothetical protein [Secundilactobacillus angelensis]
MGPDLGHLILELNPVIAIIPGLFAAYFTYLLGKRKSHREELFQEMNYWKNTAEEERKRRIKAETETDEVRQILRKERENKKEN